MKESPKINLIVAQANNRAIGFKNQLLWHLPNDFKHFKQLTTGHSILMGRKTFDSIGRALPNRRNIVISRQQNWKADSIDVAHSLEDALKMCKNESEIFIIGGSNIYSQTLSISHQIYLTTVHENFEADAFFPEIPTGEWECIEEKPQKKDEKHAYNYTFSIWIRKN